LVRGFSAEIRRVLFIGIVCSVIGITAGYLTWALIVGGLFYMAWMFSQIRRLDHWLNDPHQTPPPDASGIWGEIFDRIYKLQQSQKKEKRHLQHLVSRVQEATSALRDGVILLDRQGNMEWWNRSAQSLLGFQESDQGQALINFLRQPRFIQYFERGKFAEPLDMASPRSQNQRLQFQINRYGNQEHLVVVRNITRLYKLEGMRQDFIANVSHELRTPLTVLKGYLESIEDSGDLPDKWQGAVGQMQIQTLRMSDLVSDLITLSKLETDESEQNQSPVSMQDILEPIINEARALSGSQQHSIELSGKNTVRIMGNANELHSAFSNLVFNAVKYTQAKGQINVTVKLDEKYLWLVVEDTGMGIDSQHIPRLTERFYRVEQSRNSASGGTGLGLAIVKHILLRHDARLIIRSELGKGSTFSCRFPLSKIVEARR